MSTAEVFVPTAAARDAVKERENDILSALGIQWSGKQHIRCPYPDHTDDHPSWRWDRGKRRAYCTCTRSHSIFDVICKMKGISLDAAKVEAAEMIGRTDLIRRPRRKRNGREGAQSPSNNAATPQHSVGCTLAAYAEAKHLHLDTLKSFGISEMHYLSCPAVRIRYYSADGGEAAVRFRIALDGNDKFRWRKGDEARLYGLNRIAAARKGGKIALVEGESDCHALWQAGFPAIGLPGANNWNEERDAKYFDGIDTIYVMIEPDKGGHAVLGWLAKSKIRDRVRLVRLSGFKDPSALYLDDPARFAERWQTAIDACVRWHDEAEGKAEMKNEAEGKAPRDRECEKQADTIVRLARARASFFHAPDGAAFADVRVGGHRETWPVSSRTFKLRLTKLYYEEIRSAPSSEAVRCALNMLEATARFDGCECRVYVRVADTGGKIYLDLGNSDWSAVEIDGDGWRIVAEPPVRFQRSKGMLGLPVPKPGGDLKTLRSFLNASTSDYVLVVSWLLAALRGRGPFPILVPTGEHGTAKSTLTRILRTLSDPNCAALRSLPRNDRDLFISANNSYALCFDNVSNLPPWLSDSLARLATGGGFSTRELYTDNEESLFDAMRPIILNGIEDFVTRTDLADRAIVLTLLEIPDEKRRDEETFWAEFNNAAPLILGALLTAVSYGLKQLPGVQLDSKPRMADFAKWIVACEGSLPWEPGSFMGAYDSNRAETVETILESDAVAVAVRTLAMQGRWEGTAGDLLKIVNAAVSEETRKTKGWPKTPRGMSGALRRAAPGLRQLGLAVEFGREGNKDRRRLISIDLSDKEPRQPSEPSEPSKGLVETKLQADGQPVAAEEPSEQQSVSKRQNDAFVDRMDGSDGTLEDLTEPEETWTV